MTLRNLDRLRNVTKEKAEEIVGLFPDLFEIVELNGAKGKRGPKMVVLRLKLKDSD
jgi:hypothetical protein